MTPTDDSKSMRRTLPHHASASATGSGDFIAVCPICGPFGGRQIKADAEAIAARHAEVGGFDR